MSLALFDLLRLTYISLRANLLRSSLTSLGVFMGVAAVTSTLVVRNISNATIARQLQEREAPQVIVYPGFDLATGESAELKLEDLEFLRKRLVGWRAMSASMLAFYSQPVFFEDRQAEADGQAVSQDFLATSGRALLKGRFFTAADFAKYRPVTVIDRFLAKTLFPNEDALAKRIYVDGRPYFIVGVVEQKQSNWGEARGLMLIPISIYSAVTGNYVVESISIRPEDPLALDRIGKQATELLAQRFFGQSFEYGSNVEDIVSQQQLLNMVSLALLAVAAIALIVGGVGIANITIASVLERTPEIGLRRALGAKKRDIMFQFILEAVAVSLLGGIGAIVTVHGVTIVIADVFKLPYQFDSNTAALALSSALGVGVGASFFPALRASNLDPVKALKD